MDDHNRPPPLNDQAALVDDLQTAFCRHFCANECKANEHNDTCFCTEAGLIAGEVICSLRSQGVAAAPPPPFPSTPRLVKG